MDNSKESLKLKKLSIVAMAFAVALCLSLGGLIGVLAATLQSVGTNFNVRYEVGEHIAATVSASYQIGTAETVHTANVTTIGSVQFDSTASEHQNSEDYHRIVGGDILLDPYATYVKFTYTFENNGNSNFIAVLTDTSLAKNIVVVYGDGAEDKTIKSIGENETILNQNNILTVNVAAKETVSATILVYVDNVNLSEAEYTSTYNNGVFWTLSYVE